MYRDNYRVFFGVGGGSVGFSFVKRGASEVFPLRMMIGGGWEMIWTGLVWLKCFCPLFCLLVCVFPWHERIGIRCQYR